jgi:regulation of enolase protein 1 (concanavalin A-like superfamily)
MPTISPTRAVAKQALSLVLVLALIVPILITESASAKTVHAFAGDFNGDGATTPGIFVDGLFILSGANARGETVRFRYGRPDDVPVVGDWTGDGIDTVGIVRRGRHWHLRFSNTAGVADRSFTYGGWLGRDRPVVGDWIGKGHDLPGIIRGSTWHLRNALAGGSADITFNYGRVGRGDHPITGDWNGNGIDTAGIVRYGRWHLKNTHTGGAADWTFAFGRSDDVPVVGSWDGRKRHTPGVVRGTRWLLRDSLSGGSANIVLEFPSSGVDDEVEALRRPATNPTPPSPKPTPAPIQDASDADAWLQRLTIGAPQPSGSSTSADGVYRISAGGADIWGSRDSFEFVQRAVDGDVRFVTRVTSQTNTHAWAKAGLMIRESANAGSRHVSLFQTPANGAVLQYRSTPDSSSFHVGAVASSPPAWLRLDRSGDRFSAYVSDDGVNWKIVGSVAVPMAAVVLVGYAVTSHSGGTLGGATFRDGSMESEFESGAEPAPEPSTEPDPPASTDPEPVAPLEADGRSRLLYTADDIAVFSAAMARPGPYFATGDAGHGGAYSPGDGERSVQLARQFLSNPQASYWIQPNLPFSSGDPWPSNMQYVRPLHAAWVYMTQPGHPDRAALEREVKALLLHHANHASHDFSDASKYPVTYQGYAPRPIFDHAQWMARLIKARDMLGRESFSAAENSRLDRWFYDYSNWAFQWMHQAHYGRRLPGRLSRDYARINTWADPQRRTFDGGPLVGSLAMDYSNRQATVASTASYAANYVANFRFSAPTSGGPSYGRLSVNELLEHSRLFAEETIRFSVFPEGVQGDFERGDPNFHPNPTPQQGWLYSANVLASLVDIATYHASRGDMSVWNYGTVLGHQGTAGVPVAGGFREKNLHFYAWSMVRYVNDDWQRRNRGQPLALPQHYRDILPAAGAARFAPDDAVLRSAWRRDGRGFPRYPQSPESQGSWPAHLGEGARSIGIIEHAGVHPFGGR